MLFGGRLVVKRVALSGTGVSVFALFTQRKAGHGAGSRTGRFRNKLTYK